MTTPIDKIRTEKSCTKQGGLWLGNTCKPKTSKVVGRLDTEDLCKVAGGDLFRISDSLTMSRDGLLVTMSEPVCGFEGIHTFNGGSYTTWLPNIEGLLSPEEWSVRGLLNNAVSCSKGDIDDILDVKGGRVEYADELELKGKERDRFMKEEDPDLEGRFEDLLNNDFGFQCKDIWREVVALGEDSFRGGWVGDTQDNYDLGETERVYLHEGEIFEDADEIETTDEEVLPQNVRMGAISHVSWDLKAELERLDMDSSSEMRNMVRKIHRLSESPSFEGPTISSWGLLDFQDLYLK